MGQTHFSGSDVGGSSEQANVGNGMMGIPEWALQHNRIAGTQESADGMNLCGFNGLFKGHGRHDGGDALGKHRLARSGRAKQKDAMDN